MQDRRSTALLQAWIICKNTRETLVIVSNEIFADGVPYPPETMQYIRILGELHQKLTGKADAVYESVCGILLPVKEGNTVKSVISGLLVAFSMYSAIPVPQVNWEKQTMRVGTWLPAAHRGADRCDRVVLVLNFACISARQACFTL